MTKTSSDNCCSSIDSPKLIPIAATFILLILVIKSLTYKESFFIKFSSMIIKSSSSN